MGILGAQSKKGGWLDKKQAENTGDKAGLLSPLLPSMGFPVDGETVRPERRRLRMAYKPFN